MNYRKVAPGLLSYEEMLTPQFLVGLLCEGYLKNQQLELGATWSVHSFLVSRTCACGCMQSSAVWLLTLQTWFRFINQIFRIVYTLLHLGNWCLSSLISRIFCAHSLTTFSFTYNWNWLCPVWPFCIFTKAKPWHHGELISWSKSVLV